MAPVSSRASDARPRRRGAPYGQRWRDTWLVVSAGGVGFAFLIWDPVTVAFTWVLLTAALTAILVLTFPTTAGDDGAPAAPLVDVQWALPAAAELTAAGLATLTVLAVTPAAAVAVALTAVASSPWSVQILRGDHRRT